ncbi:MAG: universal stress protein [Sulfitobacter sp.]|nr:universal stress protein [Sulfitobacter sp.]
MFKTILAAVDGSDTGGRALKAAIDLAIKDKAKLYIVHVHLHGRPVEELERMAEIEHLVPELTGYEMPTAVRGTAMTRELLAHAAHEARVASELGDLVLRRARQQAKEAGVETVDTFSASGDYADGILDAIDETGADLVVMGRRGLGKIRQMLLGSVSNKVVQNAGCAVLLIQ